MRDEMVFRDEKGMRRSAVLFIDQVNDSFFASLIVMIKTRRMKENAKQET